MSDIKIPKLSGIKSILNNLRKIDMMKRDETISALYHAMIHGNVSFFDSAKQHELALLDVTIKKFFPLTMVKNEKKQFVCFKYSKELNIKHKETLGIKDSKEKMEWEEFYPILLTYWIENNVRAKNDQLSAEELFLKRQGKLKDLLKLYLTSGGTKEQVLDMILKLEKTMPNLSNEEKKEESKELVTENNNEVVTENNNEVVTENNNEVVTE